MQVRPIRQEEMEQYGIYVRDAFVIEDPNFIEEFVTQTKPEDTRALFDDDGNMLSGLRLIWNELWLGARKVKMAGITSVATPPEYRRGGNLKQLLRTVLAEEHDRGFNISTLYPFYFPFYKKFGYDQVSASQTVSVNLSAMGGLKSGVNGRWVNHSPDDWQKFQALYDQFCVGRFGRIERPSERNWRRGVFMVWSSSGRKPGNAYMWYDAEGQPRAYIFYHLKSIDERGWIREMRISDMAWLDDEARHEIYRFIANHDSQADKAVWDTEPGDEFFALLSDPRQAEIKLTPGYMLRLLNVERALLERAWPAETGSFSVAVHDDGLAWNHDRTYRLELSQGRPEASSIAGSGKAGLTCDVRTLAQLYAGYISPIQAAHLGKLGVHNKADLEAAQRIFSPPGQPASFMADHW